MAREKLNICSSDPGTTVELIDMQGFCKKVKNTKMKGDVGSCVHNIKDLTLKVTVKDEEPNQRKSYGSSKNELDHTNLDLTINPSLEEK